MNKNLYTTNEKINPIQIKKNIIPIKKNILENERNINSFDPFKSSPPNDFMIKLNMRNFLYHKNNDK
jgi:hypothetical protein